MNKTKQKKNIYDALIAYEINLGDEILDVLKELKMVELPENSVFVESHAWRWFDSRPSKAQKKQVLIALGYDVNKLEGGHNA